MALYLLGLLRIPVGPVRLGGRVLVDLPTRLDDVVAIVQRSGADVRVERPVLLAEFLDGVRSLLFDGVDIGPVVAAGGSDPFEGDVLHLSGELLSLAQELVPLGSVFHCLVFALLDLRVLVFPVLTAFEFFRDAVVGDEVLELVLVPSEVDLGGDYRVEPALDDVPDSWVG